LLLVVISEISIDVFYGDGDGLISHPTIYFSLSFLKLALLLAVLYSKRNVDFLRDKVVNSSFFKKKAHPGILSLFRIVYGILLFTIAFQSRQYLELTNYMTPERIPALQVFWYVWMFSIAMVTLGVGGRLFYIIACWCIGYYLDGTVGSHIFRIVGFWMIFMGTTNVRQLTLASKISFLDRWNKYSPPSSYWPVYFMGINSVLIVTSAGVSKLLDPFWLNGDGFYYTFMQPWLKSNIFNGLLSSEWLMMSMSYLTIFSEVFVFIFLFRKFRAFGWLLFLSMYILLTFVLRIDPIGPVGLCMTLGLLSITPKVYTVLFKLIRKIVKKRVVWKFADTDKPNVLKGYHYLGVLTLFLIIQVCYRTIPFSPEFYSYPKVEQPYYLADKMPLDDNTNQPDKDGTLSHKVANYLWSFGGGTAQLKIPTTLNLGGWYAPFNFHNFVGRMYYQIDFYDVDGKIVEVKNAMKVFNDDGTTNFSGPSGGVLKPRVLQNRMWKLQHFYRRLCVNKNVDELSEDDEMFINAFIGYWISRYRSEGYAELSKVSIRLKLITVPGKMEGDVSQWLNQEWIGLLDFDVRKSKLSISDTFREHELMLNKFESLKGFNISYKF
jgi:hypothetical protein